MQKSTLHLVQELTSLLLKFPELVTQFERKEPRVLLQLREWIDKAEELLSSYGIVASAELAGIRANILSPQYSDERKSSLRKRQMSAAVDQLDALQKCLQEALLPHAEKLQQSRDLIKQLLTMVSQSGGIGYQHSGGVEQLIDEVWALICHHEQLKASAVQLKSQLSRDDIRLILAQEINPAEFPVVA